MEMRIVLARVLERAALRAAEPNLAKVQLRAITLAPRDGVRVLQDRPPAPAPASPLASPPPGDTDTPPAPDPPPEPA
jgi:hypothetical protein